MDAVTLKEQMIAFWIDMITSPDNHYYMPVCFPSYAHPLHTDKYGYCPVGTTIR